MTGYGVSMSPLRFLGFGLFITVMWSLISAYIYRRLTGAHTLSLALEQRRVRWRSL